MKPIKSELYADSKGLFDTVTTLHEGRDYRMRQTVQRIRDSFESQNLNALVWIPGTENNADTLTKRSVELLKMLNTICTTGFLPAFALEENLGSEQGA